MADPNTQFFQARAMEHPQEQKKKKKAHPVKTTGVKFSAFSSNRVPQETVLNSGKCYFLKWVTEDTLKTLKEKHQEKEQEPESGGGGVFLCSYEGCGKTFTEAGALRKHSHVHGERQHVCHYEGCGRNTPHAVKLVHPQVERDIVNPKVPNTAYGSAPSDRLFTCPFEGCDKCYIHEYKLNLHLRREHAGYLVEENERNHVSESEDAMDEGSDQDGNVGKAGIITGSGRGKLRLMSKTSSATNSQRKKLNASTVDLNAKTNARAPMETKGHGKGDFQEDSEETEEDHEDTEDDGWGSETGTENDDDEETEDDMD